MNELGSFCGKHLLRDSVVGVGLRREASQRTALESNKACTHLVIRHNSLDLNHADEAEDLEVLVNLLVCCP